MTPKGIKGSFNGSRKTDGKKMLPRHGIRRGVLLWNSPLQAGRFPRVEKSSLSPSVERRCNWWGTMGNSGAQPPRMAWGLVVFLSSPSFPTDPNLYSLCLLPVCAPACPLSFPSHPFAGLLCGWAEFNPSCHGAWRG